MNKEQNIQEPTKKAWSIGGVVCSACNELIPEHEIYPEMLNMDADDIECIDCEMKFRDGADLDMFGG